jgi:shikimate kinase
MIQHKRVFLIGHPGAGKGLVGKALADKLGWRFVDADFGLEMKIGRNRAEIMGNYPQNFFDNCESNILAYQLEQENLVITTDAGIVLNEKYRQLLSHECVVYLKVSTAIQIERTARQHETLLPLDNVKTFFEQLHQERDELYEQIATLSVNTDNSVLEEHVATIAQHILKGSTAISSENDKIETVFFHQSQHIPVHLTPQQARCLKFLAQGKSAKEIAQVMNISYRTVEGNLAKTMELLGCASSKELVALYHNQP